MCNEVVKSSDQVDVIRNGSIVVHHRRESHGDTMMEPRSKLDDEKI
jgi:hypothetical protein